VFNKVVVVLEGAEEVPVRLYDKGRKYKVTKERRGRRRVEM